MAKKYLDGKVALVTGSSSGIGWGVADALAAEGATILLHGVEPHGKLEEIAQDLRHRYEGKVVAYSVNLADRAAMDEFLQTLRSLPRLDILVNNAGLQFTSPVESFPKEKWDLLLQLHLTAPFELMQAALPKMREQGWGRIVQIASVHGMVGSREKSAYVAAKHGIIGLTKVAALETAGSGITVNAVCPGWVKTPLVEAQIVARSQKEGVSITEATEELLSEKQPSKKFTETSELGALVAFLCGPSANNLTGASLPVDGAWTAQ
jgi:3-hydroxybutyrate dehydrogenase